MGPGGAALIILPAPAVAIDGALASVDGFLFGSTDDEGTFFTLAQEDGWYGSPGMRRENADRPGAHGAYFTPGYSTGRSITISGLGKAASQAAGSRSIRTMRALLAHGGLGVLTFIDEDDEVLSVLVQRDGPVEARWLSDRTFQWQMSLWSPDHRVYGVPVQESAELPGQSGGLAWPIGSFFDFGVVSANDTVTFTNTGTAPTEPDFTITPSLSSGFQITYLETGQRLVYPHAVTAELILDGGEGTASSGGQDRTGLLTVREWPSVAPGETATFQFSSLGSETNLTSPARMLLDAAPAYS